MRVRSGKIDIPRGRHTSLVIHLTAEQRQTLTAWQRSTTIRAGLARRSRLILLLSDGATITEAGRLVGLGRRFVYKWAKHFLQDGVDGLMDKLGRGHRLLSRQPDR